VKPNCEFSLSAPKAPIGQTAWKEKKGGGNEDTWALNTPEKGNNKSAMHRIAFNTVKDKMLGGAPMQYGAVFQLVKYAKGQLSTTARFWKKKKWHSESSQRRYEVRTRKPNSPLIPLRFSYGVFQFVCKIKPVANITWQYFWFISFI